MTDDDWMRLAIEKAREGIAAGQTPFGCAIVRGDRLLACEHNVVWRQTDPTAHAEVTAIRRACAAAGTIDLAGSVLYSTCEPCPMCFAAAHWAKVARVVYGAEIADARGAGFSELTLSNKEIKALGRSPVVITPGVLREECAALFQEWRAAGGREY